MFKKCKALIVLPVWLHKNHSESMSGTRRFVAASPTGWSLFSQVLNVSLSEGEQVTVEDTGGREPFILANESVLMRGLVLRSWSNQISIRFRQDQEHNSGTIQLHYQGRLGL